ncbi:MAG: hypothetical protein L6Q97_19550, partial [Thermoanaerobaculia bacterium]|nr:hypothetical protein [Thermoanaerobaculia bacterium]
TLIICTHGMPGALMIAGRLPSDAEIRAYFGNSHVQVAGQIIFEGCNVMRNPIATAQMIRDISVPGTQVSGYSLYHYSAPVNVYFPPGTDEAQCQDVLNGYMAYLASSTPPASWFASHPGRHTLLLEWFGPRTDLDLPPEYRIGDMRSRDHIPRSEMTLTTVNTRQEAESIRSRYARAPVSSLEIITITDVATACGEPW